MNGDRAANDGGGRTVARHVFVSGRVQGVNFRESMRAEAVRLGVAGWVRNLRDGRVEALVQGPAEAVEVLVAWARRGSPAARVSELRIDDASLFPPLAHSDFRRLPTA